MPVWTEDNGTTYNYLDKQVDLEANTTYRIKNSAATDLFTIVESTGAVHFSGTLTNVDVDGGTIDGLTISTSNIIGNIISGNTINNNVTGDLVGDVTGSNWTGNLTVSGDLTVNGNDVNFGGSQGLNDDVDANLFFMRNQEDNAHPTLRIKAANSHDPEALGVDNWYSDLTIETDGINTVKSYTTKEVTGLKLKHVPGENSITDSSGDYNARVEIDAVSLNGGEGFIVLGGQGGLTNVVIGSGATTNSPRLTLEASNGNTANLINRSGVVHVTKPVELATHLDIAQSTEHVSFGVDNAGKLSINDGAAGSGTDMATFTSTLTTLGGILQIGGNRINNSSGNIVLSFNGLHTTTGGDIILGGNKIDLTANATTIDLKDNVSNSLRIGALGTANFLTIHTDDNHEFIELNARRGVNGTSESTYTSPAIKCTGTTLLTADSSDSFVGSTRHSPVVQGAHTLDRYNYIQIEDPSLATGSTLTDACVLHFDENAGTHKAVDSGTTHSGIGTPEAWIKVNINDTIHYLPAYNSKT